MKYEYSFASMGNFFPIVKRKGAATLLFFQSLCLFFKLEFICIVLLLCYSEILCKLVCKNSTDFLMIFVFFFFFFIPVQVR